jgi:hypothetical protein
MFTVYGDWFPTQENGQVLGLPEGITLQLLKHDGGWEGDGKKNFYLRQLYGLEFLTQRPSSLC